MFSHQASPEGFTKTSGLSTIPFWLDNPQRPVARAPLSGVDAADLLVIGGGFTGLWAALEAKIAYPDQRIVLVEGGRIAEGASGRNGGFVSASLTHGFSNGHSRWPNDMTELHRLGVENLAAMQARVAEFAIDCDWLPSGEIDVAVADYQQDQLRETHEQMRESGIKSTLLDAAQVRQLVNSPIYRGGLVDPDVAMVDPARLAWGLARAAEELGVVIHEHSPVRSINDVGDHVEVSLAHGSIDAERVQLATNAYPPLLRRIRHYVIPVYDYVLMTRPLTDPELASIGWSGREGISDSGNQFHYYRMSEDRRILFGGYDAVYHRDNGMGTRFDQDAESFARLADHFVATFPQLSNISFTHAWGGAIDTCSRFSAFWGTAHGGRTAYVMGYTGLGVGASRFGAVTCLDLLYGRQTERTRLEMVRTKPLPFPPEPLRSEVIRWTTAAIKSADRKEGKRNLWLRLLDSLGLGFDS
ncbi:MAG: FAD-binding oxidoreductase [Candidatus Nanopelagicales bacterium]|nr:FAD-binding oxidoreductase [Candidatus Nanopelagicales bacterium]MCF8550830.1 FAD-binding oxidoreductase [Candidatus Nanopelagicales bacterium]